MCTFILYWNYVIWGPCKLHSAAHMIRMSSKRGIMLKGRVILRKLNHFNLFMALSTWILTLAILLVCMTFCIDICSNPELDGGISSLAYLYIKSSYIGNPLSAITVSYGSIKSRNPEFWTIYLSVALPPQDFETNDISPLDEIATRYFNVLCFL